jgi:acyl-CoA thioester hydrolase
MQAVMTSRIMDVEPDWIDYNGHLNMAWYNVLFDRAHDEAAAVLGLGPDYLARTGCSFFSAEAHVRYLRELHVGERVSVAIRLIDADAKRQHWWMELNALDGGFLAATSEVLSLHVDMTTKKVVPFPDGVQQRARDWVEASQKLAPPFGLGRSIGMRPHGVQ